MLNVGAIHSRQSLLCSLYIPLVAFTITKHLLLHSHMPISDGLFLPHLMLFWISLHVGWGYQSPGLWVLA